MPGQEVLLKAIFLECGTTHPLIAMNIDARADIKLKRIGSLRSGIDLIPTAECSNRITLIFVHFR